MRSKAKLEIATRGRHCLQAGTVRETTGQCHYHAWPTTSGYRNAPTYVAGTTRYREIEYNQKCIDYNDLGPFRAAIPVAVDAEAIGGFPIKIPFSEAAFFAARSPFWEFIKRPMGVAQEWISRRAGT